MDGARREPHLESALALRSMGFGGPLVAADARSVHAAGGSPAQELAFALAAAVSLLRLLEAAGVAPAEARALIAFRMAADADEFATLVEIPRVARRLVAHRRSLRP